MRRAIANASVVGWIACAVACGTYGEAPVEAIGDAATDASDSGIDPTDAGAGEVSTADAGVRRVFVTSGAYNAAIGGLTSADNQCNEAAQRAEAVASIRGRYFRAWLSGSFESAASRHRQDDARYLRTDDVQVADSWASFTDALLEAPIDRDESGTTRSGDVWTGTKADGEETTKDCSAWTSSSSMASATVGTIGPTASAWTEAREASCSSAARIYCIEY